MKTITITTEEYDKLKADKKEAEMFIAELLGAMQGLTEPPVGERWIQKVLDNTKAYFNGVKK